MLMTDRQVAAMLSVSRSTVWAAVARGELPAPIKLGGSTRWQRAEIEARVEAAALLRCDLAVDPSEKAARQRTRGRGWP